MMRAAVFSLYALLVCILLALFVPACGQKPLKFGPPHPTPEQITELARLTRPPAAAVSSRFELTLTPRVILAGTAVWVTCYAPTDSGARAIRYGLEGIRMSEGPLERIEHKLLVERVPCGTWQATCALSTGERRDLSLEVIGGECDG